MGDKLTCSSFFNLNNTAIDGDDLILSNFQVTSGERSSGSSKSTNSYTKLNLKSLSAGKLRGIFISGNMDAFATVAADKIQSYPVLTTVAQKKIDSHALTGAYLTNYTNWKNTILIFDVILGTPVISLVSRDEDVHFHFTDGPAMSSDGLFESMTAEGNGGESDDRKLDYIRGRFVDEKHIQFYFVTPDTGLEGPFEAVRK
jgi:hypothetical protein